MLFFIEILSYIARPISVSVRLFANMLSGHILLHILAGFLFQAGAINFLGASIPGSLFFGLTGIEFVIAGLQAYIFVVMLSIYTADLVAEPSH